MSHWCLEKLSMRCISLCFLLVAGACAQASKVDTMKSSLQTGEVQALSARGQAATLPVKAFRVSTPRPDGAAEQYQLGVVYDAASKLFWWKYELINPSAMDTFVQRLKDQAKPFITPDRIVCFSMGSSPTLFVRESTARADSLDAAVSKATAEFSAQLPAIADGSAQPAQRVDLARSLGSDFFNKPNQAFTPRMASVLNVGFVNGAWTLTIEGAHGDRAQVDLDSRYHLVSATLLKNK